MNLRKCVQYEDERIQASTHVTEDMRMQGSKEEHMKLKMQGCKGARIKASRDIHKDMRM